MVFSDLLFQSVAPKKKETLACFGAKKNACLFHLKNVCLFHLTPTHPSGSIPPRNLATRSLAEAQGDAGAGGLGGHAGARYKARLAELEAENAQLNETANRLVEEDRVRSLYAAPLKDLAEELQAREKASLVKIKWKIKCSCTSK